MPRPEPVLTLRLSSHSFIDTILTEANTPAYSIETEGAATILCRCTPQGLAEVATVRWPEAYYPGCKGKAREMATTVNINGRSLPAKEILHPVRLLCGALCPFNTQKFRVAGHPHSFKWSKSHGVWQCKSRSNTLVAVLEPRNVTAPLRLNIYPSASLYSEKHFDIDGYPSLDTLLVDMLVLTALLLVTAPDDWRRVPSPGQSPSETPLSTPVEERLPTPDYLREDEFAQYDQFSVSTFGYGAFDPDEPPPPYSLACPPSPKELEVVVRRPTRASRQRTLRYHVINTD